MHGHMNVKLLHKLILNVKLLGSWLKLGIYIYY
jgi:hypothetical protein